jgi:hypothetical protein
MLLLPLLLAATAQPIQQDVVGAILVESKTGATVVLPQGWSSVKTDEALQAVSDDGSAYVLLAAAEKKFDEIGADVRAAILAHLDDVTVETTAVVGVDERGALEGLVTANGTGISKRDGAEVEFAALVVRSGEAGALALGAWKDEKRAEQVAKILEGLRIEKVARSGGYTMTDPTTGASITFPEGWNVAASRRGILAAAPKRGAMIVILRWQDHFEESLAKTREVLLTQVFKDVTVGEFAVAEASYDKSLGRVVSASGKAQDRVDAKPVDFTVLRIQNVDDDEGCAIFGAWKDEKHAEQVKRTLASIKIAPEEDEE